MRRWLLVRLPIALVLLGVGFGGGTAWAFRTVPTPAPTSTSTPRPSLTAAPTLTPTSTPTVTETAAPSPTPTATSSPTSAYTPTITPTATRTPTVTATATYDPPDARVLEQANCRYGPGAAYLYEWGLYPGDRVEIIGRNDLGTWVYVDPWTYVDRCWVSASVLDVFRGDLFEAPPYYGRLPFSELYLPPQNVSATRQGDEVTVAWGPVWMTEDDYRGYLIEAWLCQGGELIFTPVRSDETILTLHDEAGCSQPSGARLYTAEKHGYTQWRNVPWPAFPPQSSVQ